jgi:leucyl/phenylalanyl-tRNA--protein transferase
VSSTPEYREQSRDLSIIPAEVLLDAYRMGIFPMADEFGQLRWFSPDPRGVLPLNAFHVPHGLKRTLKRMPFEIHVDRDFAAVISACASVRKETWIDTMIARSYCNLHRLGWAHSVEAWKEGHLAGGLYGVSIGGVFFGESMFHYETDASKVALWALVERMKQRHFALLDIQWITPHLRQFGATTIRRREYLGLLHDALRIETSFV